MMLLTFFFDAIGGGITHGWSGLANAGKIFLGQFNLDENKSFGKAVTEGISRFTFQLPQEEIGYGFSQINNTFGGVNEVQYLGGATFSIGTHRNGDSWGVTMGSFINARLNMTHHTDRITREPLLMHEYGHYIQSQRYGLKYLPSKALPSLIGQMHSVPVPGWGSIGLTTHNIQPVEMDANRNAARYFGRNYGVDWINYIPPLNTYPTRWPL